MCVHLFNVCQCVCESLQLECGKCGQFEQSGSPGRSGRRGGAPAALVWQHRAAAAALTGCRGCCWAAAVVAAQGEAAQGEAAEVQLALAMSAANPFATLGGSDVSSEEEVEPEPVSGCAMWASAAACTSLSAPACA